MNLNEIEGKHIKPCGHEAKRKSELSSEESDGNSSVEQVSSNHSWQPSSRSTGDWMLILRLSVGLSICIGLILGLVSGVFIGSNIGASHPSETDEVSIYDQYDYSQFVINKAQNITIDNFYSDVKEKYYAMSLIGQTLPILTYVDKNDETHTTETLGEGNYIIEFFEPDCAFCQSMIEELNEYRARQDSLPILGLSIEDADISKFNGDKETSFVLVQKDLETDMLLNQIAWIPTFVYVSNGEIKLVSFGVLDSKSIDKNIKIAFEQ